MDSESPEADPPDYPRYTNSASLQPGSNASFFGSEQPGSNASLFELEQPEGQDSVVESGENTTFLRQPQLPVKIPFYRRRDGIIIIILLIAIVIGGVVGGAVGGTEVSTQTTQRSSSLANPTTVESLSVITTTMTTLAPNTTTLAPNTTTLAPNTTTLASNAPTSLSPISASSTTTLSASSRTVTPTTSAPSPTPSNCVWEGTAPFCDGNCLTGFTQIMEDNCGNGDCCLTGFKVYCCQE